MFLGIGIHLFQKKHKVNILSIALIVLTYPLGYVWHFYDTYYYETQRWDWFYDLQFSDTPAWIVKWTLDEISNLMIAAAFLIASWKNTFMRCILIEYTAYRSLEIWRYFKNFKTVEYNLIYLITFGVGILVWYLTLKNKK